MISPIPFSVDPCLVKINIHPERKKSGSQKKDYPEPGIPVKGTIFK
jgi:hypothetical protein